MALVEEQVSRLGLEAADAALILLVLPYCKHVHPQQLALFHQVVLHKVQPLLAGVVQTQITITTAL